MMIEISNLIQVADAYREATGLKETTVSTKVFDDGKKLTALREGSVDIGVRRFHTALLWFSEHWPDDAEWPSTIARPLAEKAA